MSTAVGSFKRPRGGGVSRGLRVTTGEPFDGSETVTCGVKQALNGVSTPPRETQVLEYFTVSFNADTLSYSLELSPQQTESLGSGSFIFDAKIVFADGRIEYAKPIVMILEEGVTP